MAALLAALPVPGGAAPLGVPVRVGGSGAEDACGTVAQVTGVGARGFLAVRAGPGVRFATRDRLGTGRPLRVCEERGPWLGVVYGATATACGTATPVRRRRAYAGPCRQGWVSRRYVEPLAG